MTRGFRGATTVSENDETEILTETRRVLQKVIDDHDISPEDISHIFFSVTDDLNATFPAKAARLIEGFTHVPVMCMKEIDVPNSLDKCIRMMLVAKTDLDQKDIKHVFLNQAVRLRPDLNEENEGSK